MKRPVTPGHVLILAFILSYCVLVTIVVVYKWKDNQIEVTQQNTKHVQLH